MPAPDSDPDSSPDSDPVSDGAATRPRFAVVLLAGGSGSRVGGRDKAALQVGGRTLLDRALAACEGAEAIVVVGDPREVDGPAVRFVRESPVGSGPAAAIAAGVSALEGAAEYVVALAVDMPHVQAATLDRLLRAGAAPAADGSPTDGAVLVDSDGRRHLALALAAGPLDACLAAAGDVTGASVWRTLANLRLADVPAHGNEHLDIDTPDDLARAVRYLG